MGQVVIVIFVVIGIFDYLLIYAASEHRRE